MRLLCIANPAAYKGTVTDVPLSYARLAAHPDIELFHADTRAMLSPGRWIRATPVAAGFMPDEFGQLSQRTSNQFLPDQFDLAFCRTLKPFPTGYLKHLAQWSSGLRFVNDPSGIQRQLEPQFFLDAAQAFIPPSVVTADEIQASQFQKRQGTIVAKRTNSCGGRGVYRISSSSGGSFVMDNVVEGTAEFTRFSQLFAHLTRDGSESILLMRYLPRVTEGDKRLVVVDGEIFGTYLRSSPKGHWVQNVSFGGSSTLVPAEPEDQVIIDATHAHYKRAGIHILGYDLLKDDDGSSKVSEINAGNVGGLFRIEYLGIPGATDRFVSWLNNFYKRAGEPRARVESPGTARQIENT